MPSPTYSWNNIAATQTDAESPLDTTLMEGIRQNLTHLKEWLGGGFAPAVDHDHDGVNSKSVALANGAVVTAKLADAGVTAAKLKMARGSYTASSGGTHYVTLNRYSHIPSAYKAGGTYNMQLALQSRNGPAWATTETSEISVVVDPSSTESFYVYWDYHTD